MIVKSHNVKSSIKNRLKTPRLVIIEFVLGELPDTGSSGHMLYLSLFPNYINKRDLHFEQIRFDLKNDKAIQDHMDEVSKKVGELRKM
jgi:hypothetical protein